MLSRKKGNLVLIGKAVERRTRGDFERWRLGGLVVEIEEGLRWAGGGDRGWFGWASSGGKRGIGVTGDRVLDFLVLFERERERERERESILYTYVRVPFSLAHRPKDPGSNSCSLVD